MKRTNTPALALLAICLSIPVTTAAPVAGDIQSDEMQSAEKPISPAIQPPDGGDPSAPPAEDAMLERAMRSLTGQLGLTEDQAERMKPMLARHHADIRGLRAEFKDWPEESGRQVFRQNLQTTRGSFHDELSSVLSPEQLEKFKKLQKNNRHRARAAQEPE